MLCVQISDFALGDSLSTAINLNLTVGAATAPLVAAPGQNNTVVTVRSAQSVADIIKYNMTACMVGAFTRLSAPLSDIFCHCKRSSVEGNAGTAQET
jgi:hypothetical protein